jgi:hypothetical protein
MWNFGRTLLVLFSIGMLVIVPNTSHASQVNHAPSPATILSIYDQYCSGGWFSGSPRTKEESLPCPGSDTDERGFVRRLGANFTLEDNQSALRSIETHPKWVPNGYILGAFSLNSLGIKLEQGDSFRAKIGFLKGAQEGRAQFSVWYDGTPGQTGGEARLFEATDSYDTKLIDINVNLSNYAGGSGTILLRVDALESSGQDWAVWVNPRIERVQLPTATHTPTPTATAQPTATFTPTTLPTPTSTPTATPMPTILAPSPPPPIEGPIELIEGFSFITDGPVMPGAFGDGDEDGVMNLWDECLHTPEELRDLVFENGCLCQDSDGGLNYTEQGSLTYRFSGGEGGGSDYCSGGMLREFACNPDYEEGRVDYTEARLMRDVTCSSLGPDYQCRDGRCIPVREAIPMFCWSSDGTCADGIQNQDEEGVDCGGKCPPCNTRCTTGTKYAPPDTPCTTYYPTDTHRIDWPWTDNEFEYTCQFHEVCHPDLDHVIEEATRCCSIQSTHSGMTSGESLAAMEAEINAMPDPELCREARNLTGRSASCKKCVGLYIIKGLGNFARWMVGYTWLYPEHNVYGDIDQAPAEQLINDYQTGVCRDYSEALTTLLRKAGYSPREVGGFCDGAHCYNVVKLPGESNWHVVDTTGNNIGINFGGLPSGYPYCQNLEESNWCWDGVLSTGGSCTGSELKDIEHTFSCQPGLCCGRDLLSIPGWAPTTDQIVGCGS